MKRKVNVKIAGNSDLEACQRARIRNIAIIGDTLRSRN